MHPVHIDRYYSTNPASQADNPHAASVSETGPVRRWLARAARRWKQRRMIAVFNAMDDRLLEEIGIRRADIDRVVAGFDERELRMNPVVSHSDEMAIYDDIFQRAA